MIEEQNNTINELNIGFGTSKLNIEEIQLTLKKLKISKAEVSDLNIFKLNVGRDYKILKQLTGDLSEKVKKTDNYIDKQVNSMSSILQIPLNLVKTLAQTLDYITVSNDQKVKIQETIQERLDNLKEKFMNDKGWPEDGNNLDSTSDKIFRWIPKYDDGGERGEREEESESERSISLMIEGKVIKYKIH